MRRWLILAAVVLASPLAAAADQAAGPLARARAALDRNDGIAAEAALNQAMDAGADPLDIPAEMGEALIAQGELGKAREWLAPGQFPRGKEAYGWRMTALLERRAGNLAAAGAAYDRALRYTPNDPQLWVDIARLRYSGGEHTLAIEAAERALAVGPENPRALALRAELLRDAEGWESALPLYARALAAAPGDAALMASYAATLGEAGRGREMLAMTRDLIAQSPRNPQPWFYQAVIAARAGNTDLARAMLSRAGEAVEQWPAGLLFAGAMELEAGNANAAMGLFERLADRQPANQRAQLLLARALYEADEHDALLQRFGAVADRVDAPPYLLTIVARALEERGDRAAAAALLDRAAAAAPLPLAGIPPGAQRGDLAADWQANPSDPGKAVPLVRTLLSQSNLPGADAVAARYLSLRPNSADALALAGDIDLVAGRNDRAIDRYIGSARVRFPDFLLLRMCAVYASADRSGEGQAMAARYLAAYPSSLLAMRLRADYAAVSGDLPYAQALLAQHVRRDGKRDARVLSDLAFAQLQTGDERAARRNAERAWDLAPQSPAAAKALALALAESGAEPDLALQLLDLAEALGGRDPLLAAARLKLTG